MCSRIKRMTFLAVATMVVLSTPMAMADSPRCAEVANSPLAEPDWYAEECLGGAGPEGPAAAPGPWRVPGDIAWLHNIRGAGPFPSSLTTAPLPTFTLTNIGPNARPIFAMDFDLAAAVLWGIDNTTRELGTYSLTTGAFTPTGAVTGIPVAETISSLKFDPTSSTVYVSATTGVISNLYTLNLTTRVATLVGPIGFALVIDIAISNTGLMFGHDIGVDQLISINKTTGVGTPIGSTTQNANFAQGMDFDWSDNTLYAWIYIGGGVNNLSRFNLTTGAAVIAIAGPAGPEHEGAVRVPAGGGTVSVAPFANSVDAGGNGVFQPNETVTMAPTWRNTGTTPVGLTGTLTNFNGPPTATYTIVDPSATYASIAAGATGSCGASCYSLNVVAATRPAVHWDSTVLETVNPSATTKTWTLHIGDSFTDVPATNGFYRFIETIFHRGITGGCTPTTYCPANPTTREQMAVFVLIAKEGAGYTPAACGTPMFADVPASSPFCRFIEELARRGVVAGCGGNPPNYCPTQPVTREQMAVFVLRTLDGTLNPPACLPPNLFADVPETSPFCRWIEELANRGVVTGCGGGNYCPLDPVTREQMSVFLVVTFGLVLYGL